MLQQYLKFAINGGVLGLAAWALQGAIYKGLGSGSAGMYAAATALTYVPLVLINFLIQRTWIFKRPGLFSRFVLANLSVMLLVSLLSPLCRNLIDAAIGAPWGDRTGFIAAALLGSVPSFLIKRYWVFRWRMSAKEKLASTPPLLSACRREQGYRTKSGLDPKSGNTR